MQRISTPSATHPRQGGAVIIVVVSLMAALAFLGFFFFTFADQEQSNARNYASAESYAIDPDPVFDFALQQYIVSTPDGYADSVLHGNKWSLLANLLGTMNPNGSPTDVHPHSGMGINIIDQGGGAFDVDYDSDGTGDRTDANFIVNFSRVAHGGTTDAFNLLVDPVPDFDPDAGYTYPDINSPFLALDYDDGGERLIKPSFMLPGLFDPSSYAGLYLNPNYKAQVMRPHQSHENADGSPRFLSMPTPAQSGDRTRVIQPMDFTLARMGLWDGGDSNYDLDVDADNDGINDAILMDLDHPIIDLPGGRQVVPLFAPKIIDADGLLNVNAHGNLEGALKLGRSFNGGEPFSVSNLGLSPGEINPGWALTADPAEYSGTDLQLAQQEHAAEFGFPVGTAQSVQSMSNMELAFLLTGRIPTTSSLPIEGRWGEGARIVAGHTPYPGTSEYDDDLDSTNTLSANSFGYSNGLNPYGGFPMVSGMLNDLQASPAPPLVESPPFVHPLDYLGIGTYLDLDITRGAFRKRDSQIADTPVRVLTYEGNWEDQGTATVNGVRTWRTAAGSPPPQAGAISGLVDEPDETILEPAFRQPSDAVFLPEEMAALHLSDADWHGAGMDSRLRKLLPFNFEFSSDAEKIRKRFTTDSWSRLEFSHARHEGTNVSRGWEFSDGEDLNNDGVLDPNEDLNDNSVLDTFVRFPPVFRGNGRYLTSRHEGLKPHAGLRTPIISVEDPFRPLVRRLLTVDISNAENVGVERLRPQHRLNLNRLLVNFDRFGNPIYRQLTPHPVFDGSETEGTPPYLIDSVGVARQMYHEHPLYSQNFYDPDVHSLDELDPPIPATGTYAEVPLSLIRSNKFAQEMWARYDRQRLARDIYVLLYTLSGYVGNSSNVDRTDITMTAVDPALAREMAQFAVNYVDALDRDDVITRFEYDPDLSDGWQWSSGGPYVLGVESQLLTFSEVMVIRATGDPGVGATDDPRTLHDETVSEENRWLYIELRNTSPFDVALETGSWRIVRTAVNDHTPVAAIEFKSDPSGNYRSVEAGGNFLIATNDGTVVNGAGQNIPADFYADFDDFGGGADPNELEMFVPHHNGTTTVANNNERPVPHAHLDLAYDDPTHLNYYSRNPAGARLVNPGVGGANFEAFDLVLQRRRNLHAANLTEADSEWVEVDRVRVTVADATEFDITAANGNASRLEIHNKLLGVGGMNAGVFSVEREQPFFTNGTTSPELNPHSKGSYPTHSFERAFIDPNATPRVDEPDRNKKNDSFVGSTFDTWQPHFNRDFFSKYELLAIPLYGHVDVSETTPFNSAQQGATVFNLMDGTTLSGHNTASRRFLEPDGAVPNRWYRLFEFVDTSTRTHEALAPQYARPIDGSRAELRVVRRTPGKINLNTIRHESVLAGLVDDPYHFANPFSTGTDDRFDGTARNWFQRLLDERDGPGAYPGTPTARPFRPLSYVNPTAPSRSLDYTILRSIDVSGVQLGLFEARASADTTNDVDYHTRNRLLAKIANNSTVSSNVFAMWLVVQFHEAHRTSSGAVQIGAKAEGLPVYRLFCVIDRSRLEEAYDPDSGTFDFRKFIIHRQMLP